LTNNIKHYIISLYSIGAIMTDDHAIELGKAVADLLYLRFKDGKYDTSWGFKTPLGLGRVIEELYLDHRPVQMDLITEYGIEPVVTQI
jgi:hypothetical protein